MVSIGRIGCVDTGTAVSKTIHLRFLRFGFQLFQDLARPRKEIDQIEFANIGIAHSR
jgi:hypothetical protein